MNGVLGVRWDDLPLLRERAATLLENGPARTPAVAERMLGIRRGPEQLTASLVREVLDGDPRFQVEQGCWLLCAEPAAYGSHPLSDLEFAVVDVEATGGSPARGDRVTEVAAVRVRGGRVVDSFESLVNPERSIPPAVTALTRITDEMVAGAPSFRELAGPLRGWLEGAVFVAHNVSFDWRFLRAEFERCQGGRLDGERLCTLRLARRIHPELQRRSLGVLADYYSIPVEEWHRAGPDARMTAEIFVRFLGKLSEAGVEDWARLQAYLKGEYPPDETKGKRRRKRRKTIIH
ncbi:MAG: 3'-5' exonuclease [Gemmatimonadota bacterium]|nr:MAG: 3'-5' exonuclease [Gemmatimonadota bacterium]